MYELLKTEGTARRAQFHTVHGTVQTPAFMNVATCGAIKGGVSAYDLQQIKCQVQLCNTYHLHVRPGDQVVAQMCGFPLMSTAGKYLWGRSRVCRSSRTWRLPSLWRLMSV